TPVVGLAVEGAPSVNLPPAQSRLPFSRARVAGGLVHVAGTLPVTETGALVGNDIGDQTRAVLDRVGTTLAESGSDLRSAVAVTVYLKRASDFAAMNEVYRTYFPDAPPTRTTVGAELVRRDALVEVSVVAAAKGTSRRVIHPSSWMASLNPYSYAIEAGDLVFLSGLVPRSGRDNSNIDGDVDVQTRAILENAREILEEAGLGLDHVVSARVFVSDAAHRDRMNAVYRPFFAHDPPARATVVAGLMHPSFLVEMTFVASRVPKIAIADEAVANPNFSAAIRTGSHVFVSGMIGVAPGSTADARAQTREALQHVSHLLARAGSGWNDVVHTLVYLKDIGDDAAMNEAYLGVLAPPFPARTTVQAPLLIPEGLVEVMVTAVTP
ncbi:MAG TPA: RidA family protein, partial [Gemmatimonadaceae bacterium]|nr:RidA family protein [Gemmatimonadaceae bacterium]